MKDFTTFFFILICITIFYVYLENKAVDVTYVKTHNVEFLVRNLPDKEEAALLLSKIRERLLQIVEHTTRKKKLENKDKDKDKEHIDALKRLKKNYKPNNITESSPGNKYTSYSINKGEKIVFCLRSKETNKLVDINTMMFVAIHELAHLMTKSIGHTTEFWDNMRFLLKEGIKLKVYEKQDFNKVPVEYCGTQITDTPLNN
jgi:predicted metal-dependent hydrolase